MILKIVIGIAAVFAFLWSIKAKNKFCLWITIGAAVATGISLVDAQVIAYDGYVAYLIILGVFILYTFSPNDFDDQKKILISTIILFPAVYMILDLTSHRGNNIVGLLCVLSVAAFLYVLFKARERFSDELGFLAIAFTHAVVRLTLTIMTLI